MRKVQSPYAQSFKSFVESSQIDPMPRLVDWLVALPDCDLTVLHSTVMRCWEGDGTREEEDDVLHVTQIHHVLEHGETIQSDDVPGWHGAFDGLREKIRLERYRRLNLDPSLMESLFHG